MATAPEPFQYTGPATATEIRASAPSQVPQSGHKKRKLSFSFSSSSSSSSIATTAVSSLDLKAPRDSLAQVASAINLNVSFDNPDHQRLVPWTKLAEEFHDKEDGHQPTPQQVNALAELLEKSDVPVYYEANDKDCWDINLDCALRMLVRAGAKYVTDQTVGPTLHPFVHAFPKLLDSAWLKHQNSSEDDGPLIGALTVNLALYKFRAAVPLQLR